MVRLVLYNVRYGTGTGLTYHLPIPFSGNFRRSIQKFNDIKSFLQGLSPDLIGMVEADGGSYRHGGECQARTMASFMKGESSFAVKYGRHLSKLPILRSQGNAVVSKEQPALVRQHDLGKGMKRNALEVVFRDFSMVLVHLSLGRSSRKHQIEELRRICASRTGPMILAGDYNAFYGPEELDPLKKEGLSTANISGKPTFPCRNPKKELDFILISREIILEDFFIPETDLSDHLPLVCDFRIRRKGGDEKP